MLVFSNIMMNNQFKLIPSVDKIIADPRMVSAVNILPREKVVLIVRRFLDRLRNDLSEGAACPSMDEITQAILEDIRKLVQPNLAPVINATGVILHTNLGRSLLSSESISAIQSAAEFYSNLEFDIYSGKRGQRSDHVEQLLCLLTGAEAAFVVNNNAAAVLIALASLARRREVIVSRGQAVEIGGKFRVPDVMKQSGAKLVEVGTTNRTYISDYEEAVTEKTAALLSVHRSNFTTVGFTHDVELEEMVRIAKQHDLIVIHDLGSGCIINTSQFGLLSEPTVNQSIECDADVVCFSGDKLLGGPQSGIIVGRKKLIDKIKKHPMSRACRIDKLCLSALAPTLIHYLKGEALEKIPFWQMVSASVDELKFRAEKLAADIGETADTVSGISTIGAGSIPGSTLPTWLIAIKPATKIQQFARRLRIQPPHIIGRIEKNTLYLDLRTVLPHNDVEIAAAVKSALQ